MFFFFCYINVEIIIMLNLKIELGLFFNVENWFEGGFFESGKMRLKVVNFY